MDLEKTSLNAFSENPTSFEFNNVYKDYLKVPLKNKGKKEYSPTKQLDFALLGDAPFIPVKELSPGSPYSLGSPSSSLLNIHQEYVPENDSSAQTVSLYDVVLKSSDEDLNILNGYSDYGLYSQTKDVQEINFPATYILNIFGIPEKSRVETQIKLEMKLSYNSSLNVLPEFSYSWLKLPRWSITKEKLKLPNLKNFPKNINPEKILTVEPSVVCASDVKKNVLICSGCIMRERKRALRKKKSLVDFSDKSSAQEGLHVPIEDEEKKIIVFNHPEISEFKNNYINIPTRITCYCRHHKENVGFRILINIRDSKEQLIASTLSRPFMITDDHKTSAKLKIKEMNRFHSTLNLLPQFLNFTNNNTNNQKWKNPAFKTRLHRKTHKNSEKLSTGKLESGIDVQKSIYPSLSLTTDDGLTCPVSDEFFNPSTESLLQSSHIPLIYFHENTSHENDSFMLRDRFMESTSLEDLFMSENTLETESAIVSRESPLISDEESPLEITHRMQSFGSESNLFNFSNQSKWSNKRFSENISQIDLSDQMDISISNNMSAGLSLNPNNIHVINRLAPS